MTLEIFLLLVILGFTVLAFVTEWRSLDVTALASLGALLVCGLVTPREAISGFSNEAVITVMMMFVLSHGLAHSGLITKVAHRLAGLSGPTHWRGSVTLMLVAGLLSAFVNNVAALTIFMPVGIHIATHYRLSPSKFLLPLSYATIFGGACTLVGTSTNLLISSLAADYGFEPLTMFEFFGLGAILFAVGMAYNVGMMRYLPSRAILSSLTRKYHLGAYLTELEVPATSRMAGRTVVDERISERFQLNVLEVIRGKGRIAADLRNTRLRAGDLLMVRGSLESILAFREQYRLLLLTDTKLGDEDLSDKDNILMEMQLSPTTRHTGATIREINFRKRYGCFVLALNRTGELIREKLTSIPLKHWDTLLIFGPRARVETLGTNEEFIPLQELDVQLRLRPNWWIAALVMPAVMVPAACGATSILEASILGVVVLLVSRALTVQQAYRAINWTVIFMVAAILPMGKAMVNTGLAQVLGESVAAFGSAFGPLAVVTVLYLATSLLTELMSNNSTAVLMVPIAASTAEFLQLDPKTFVMAVAFAASASFLTPMGYHTNAMVYGPGGYRFLDYIKAGLPLKIVFWVLTVLLVPLFWPIG